MKTHLQTHKLTHMHSYTHHTHNRRHTQPPYMHAHTHTQRETGIPEKSNYQKSFDGEKLIRTKNCKGLKIYFFIFPEKNLYDFFDI